MEEPSALLLERARSGDRLALEQLLERHEAQIYRFGMKMCRDPEAAKDVLQDTLIAMARGVRDFQGASSLSTWLYTIARSFCIKHRRRDAVRAGHEGAPGHDQETRDCADPAAMPDEVLAGKEVESALERAIAGLEPLSREVLVLRDMEGLTAPEVAKVLGLSVQAVKSRLHRARMDVREQLLPILRVPSAAAAAGCPDVVRMFSQHLEDEIKPDACVAMQLHLDACEHCRANCDSLKRTLLMCQRSASKADVPLAVQRSVKEALRELLQSAD